jgi:CBS-domain-containing membrane protein
MSFSNIFKKAALGLSLSICVLSNTGCQADRKEKNALLDTLTTDIITKNKFKNNLAAISLEQLADLHKMNCTIVYDNSTATSYLHRKEKSAQIVIGTSDFQMYTACIFSDYMKKNSYSKKDTIFVIARRLISDGFAGYDEYSVISTSKAGIVLPIKELKNARF